MRAPIEEERLAAWSSPAVCSGSEAGSYLRLIDSCITQLKAQGPSRTCNESKEAEEEGEESAFRGGGVDTRLARRGLSGVESCNTVYEDPPCGRASCCVEFTCRVQRFCLCLVGLTSLSCLCLVGLTSLVGSVRGGM